MAKDDREILHAIRFPVEHEGRKESQIFSAGMEEELAEVATAAQLKAWSEAGHIQGTWTPTKPEAKKPEAKKPEAKKPEAKKPEAKK